MNKMTNGFKITVRTHNDKSIWTYKEVSNWKEAKEVHKELIELLEFAGETIHLPYEARTIYVNTISSKPYIRANKTTQ